MVMLALGGALEHQGRDGEAFGAWGDEQPTSPQELPMPPDLDPGELARSALNRSERLTSAAAKFQERLREQGLGVTVQMLPGSTRTAPEAAAVVGCEVGQIVKSLVFMRGEEPVMVLCAGDRRVAADRLGLRPATAEEARAGTGFAIGGIPPLGHDRPLETLIESRYAGSRRCGPRQARHTPCSRAGTEALIAAIPGGASPTSADPGCCNLPVPGIRLGAQMPGHAVNAGADPPRDLGRF